MPLRKRKKPNPAKPKYKILLFVESSYQVDRKMVRGCVAELLKNAGIKSEVEVGVSIVGKRKMRYLNEQYRGKKGTTPVLAFSQLAGEKFPRVDDVLRLGDVVVAYPEALEIARQEGKLLDETICSLVQHGLKQLLHI